MGHHLRLSVLPRKLLATALLRRRCRLSVAALVGLHAVDRRPTSSGGERPKGAATGFPIPTMLAYHRHQPPGRRLLPVCRGVSVSSTPEREPRQRIGRALVVTVSFPSTHFGKSSAASCGSCIAFSGMSMSFTNGAGLPRKLTRICSAFGLGTEEEELTGSWMLM